MWKCVINTFFLGFSFCVLVIPETFGLTGDNVCEETEHFIITVQKVHKKPVQIREYKWCMQIPPRCEETRTIFKDEFRIEEQPHTRIVKKCCEGFREDIKTDTCTLSECQLCKHASCSNEGQCICYAGYKGKYCDSVCPKGTWGFQCSFACECENNATCSPADGRCICTTGWIGLKCNIPCPYGFYGDNCSKFCQCFPRLTCHPQTGECLNQEVPGKYTTTPSTIVTSNPTEPSLVKLKILNGDKVSEKKQSLANEMEKKKIYVLKAKDNGTLSTRKEDKALSGQVEDKIKLTTVSMRDVLKPILTESMTTTVAIPSSTQSTFSSPENSTTRISETSSSTPSTLLTSSSAKTSVSSSPSPTTVNLQISKASPSTTSLFDSTEAIDFDNFFNPTHNKNEEEKDEIINFSGETFDEPTVEPTNFLVEESSTKRSNLIDSNDLSPTNLSKIFKLNDLVQTRVIDEDDATKDLEQNNDLIHRVHHSITENHLTTHRPHQAKFPFIDPGDNDEEIGDNQREQDLALVHENYHGMIIAVCGVSLGVILAVILAALILHITDTKPRNNMFFGAQKKEIVQPRVQYLATNNYQEQETVSVLNPIFSSEPESKLKAFHDINSDNKIDDFITDSLRVAFDNTYDHPRTIKLQTSTFSAPISSFPEVEPFYDEIPGWNEQQMQANELRSFASHESSESSYINANTLRNSTITSDTDITRL